MWELLSPWLGPDDAELTRYAVYEFRAQVAETMRRDRVFLAGDAAHLMPPFLGQGLCSGIRDAGNLAWKLDLVLRGEAGEDLLDSYTAERKPQCEWIVRLSMEMARVSCELDPAAAAERDAALRASETPPPIGLPGITEGLLQERSEDGPNALAGEFSVQGTVSAPAGEGRFDDVVGRGFVLLTAEGDPRAALSAEELAFLESLGDALGIAGPRAGRRRSGRGRPAHVVARRPRRRRGDRAARLLCIRRGEQRRGSPDAGP